MFYLLILLSLCSLSFASINDQIKNFILSEKALKLEDVVKKLPEELRRNFTLVRDGRALIESSDQYPGAILFGTDARILLAFGGSSKQFGYASLDVLEFNEESKQYVPARFLFSPGPKDLKLAKSAVELGSTKVYFEPSPQLCKNCHGINHHPIFETGYPDWKGFYGSTRDHLYGSDLKEEIQAFKKFREIKATNPRYQALIFPSESFSSVSPFLDTETEHRLGYGAAHAYRPNLMMGVLLVRNNARTILSLINESVYGEEFKMLLAYALEKCDMSALPLEKINLRVAGLSTSPDFNQLSLNSTSLLEPGLAFNRSIAARLISILGISADLWNLSLVTKKPVLEFGYWSGYGDIYELVHAGLIKDLGLQNLYQVRSLGLTMDSDAQEIEQRLNFLGEMLESKNSKISCQTMASSLQKKFP